jgi:hypothetical protein
MRSKIRTGYDYAESLLQFLPPDWHEVPKRRPGRPKGQNLERDKIAVSWILTLQQKGFAPTRTSIKRNSEQDESACAVVAWALRRAGFEGIGEAGVEKIWQNYLRAQKPPEDRPK